jgi:hypothetical protein
MEYNLGFYRNHLYSMLWSYWEIDTILVDFLESMIVVKTSYLTSTINSFKELVFFVGIHFSLNKRMIL